MNRHKWSSNLHATSRLTAVGTGGIKRRKWKSRSSWRTLITYIYIHIMIYNERKLPEDWVIESIMNLTTERKTGSFPISSKLPLLNDVM